MVMEKHTGYPIDTGGILQAMFGEVNGYAVVATGGESTVTVLWDAEQMGRPVPTVSELDIQRAETRRQQQEITRLQARLQLLDTPDPTGQFDNAWETVNAWAHAHGGATLAYFEDAQHWRRLDQFVIAGGAEFGWSDDDLDQLFAAAAQR